MEIHAIDHVELFVDDLKSAAGHLCDSYGFAVTGRGGPDTGLAGCESLLLRQHDITLLLTAALDPAHRAAQYVRRHGDGVAVLGLAVDDAEDSFATAVERGAEPVAPAEHRAGGVAFASVGGFGDVEYRFTSRTDPAGPFAPGIIEEFGNGPAFVGALRAIDHFAVCVPAGRLAETVRRHREVFGFEQTFEEVIIVGGQSMISKVVQSPSRAVTLTVIEPDTTREPGQIDRFLAAHDGAGVQHVAFLADSITRAVRECERQGVRFLDTPAAYYSQLPGRLGDVGVPLEELRELNILADRDQRGVMLQIFAASRHDRGTLFYELIERRGARTFGSNNIKALYEAIERHPTDQVGRA
ncbi:4-hydroxyphenylpyruvate dioxygenase [Actinomadura macrotermitis]|uniref:4-hydroxymandelate synthase n=1 Tax=Actinomadura macrotermitis TaxID=2585200 RepID=A0A7K0BPL8_9ACTN|nr:4-hydroxymandelate synthase [Actinomadura macrotermitis]